MGKPRMIIVIRHAQSEGNQNRQIHQRVPDHRVKLTQEGRNQAKEAGKRLRALLHPSDTLQFYTSPYKRTRETTEGILDSLTGDSPETSPFPRESIKVWEEPRLREQDFGNFQPSSETMERMWQERADYGHFFYRIPNGESAADAYDRVSGFNESLWRSFGEHDFPSVCVLVTHGLMTRVFLMKWYHWSVEYFEDLRNVNHCEFVIMNRSPDSGKFILENKLRTWTELKRRAAAEKGESESQPLRSPPIRKRWRGCQEDPDHAHDDYPRRTKPRTTKADSISHASGTESQAKAEDGSATPSQNQNTDTAAECIEEDDEAFPEVTENSNSDLNAKERTQMSSQAPNEVSHRLKEGLKLDPLPLYLVAGRDFGGTDSGAPTPFYEGDEQPSMISEGTGFDDQRLAGANVSKDGTSDLVHRHADDNQERTWVGMNTGARADALGDQQQSDEHDSPVEPPSQQIEDLETQTESVEESVY